LWHLQNFLQYINISYLSLPPPPVSFTPPCNFYVFVFFCFLWICFYFLFS
jgi:hypothetical protein